MGEMFGDVGTRLVIKHFEDEPALPSASNRFRADDTDDEHLVRSGKHRRCAFDLRSSDFSNDKSTCADIAMQRYVDV